MKKILCFLALNLFLFGQKDLMLEVIQSMIPSTKIEKVERFYSTYLYQVYLKNGKYLYADPTNKLLFFGEILTTTGTNLTADKRETWSNERKAEKYKFSKSQIANIKMLSFKDFSLNGEKLSKYDLIIFESPTCPYCQKVHNYLQNKEFTAYRVISQTSLAKNIVEVKLQERRKQELENLGYSQEKILNALKSDQKGFEEVAQKKVETMLSLFEFHDIQSVPLILILNKNEDKVVEVIKGADLEKISKYF